MSAVVRALEVLGQAALLGGALLRSARVAVVPPALLGVQLMCAWSFATSGNAYRDTGSAGDLAVAVVAPLLGCAAAAVTWSLWSGERPRRCADSVARTGRHIAVWTAVVVPVTSWLVCAPYLINHQGAVRPGLVFYGSTALFFGALAVGVVNGRWRAGQRAG